MVKSSQRTFLVLLSVVLVALFCGLFLRGMIIKDFQDYVEGERAALVRLVLSDLVESREKSQKWDKTAAAEIVVRSLNLGLQLKLVDAHGNAVMDTAQALALLPSDRAVRIRTASGFNGDDTGKGYRPYSLVIGRESLGRLDVKFLGGDRADAFISRSGLIVLLSMLFLAVLALTVAALVSRKQTVPARKFVPEAFAAAAGLHAGRSAAAKREGAVLLLEPEEEKASVVVQVLSMDDDPESMPDDPLDADDEDMQPLAGDPERISKIVKGLDGLAKAQALRGALEKQPLELSPYLNNIVEKTHESFPGTDVTFKVECRSDLRMSVDPECLMGIMINLLDNAAKAVKHAGTVTVSATEKGDQMEFSVRDTGAGISRKALPHIFERFYRGSGDGIGLGLTIVKELVNACGGAIAVQSTRGKGSVFTVCIPRT